MNPAPPVMSNVPSPLDSCALRILQRQPQLLRERVDRRAGALPRALGLEPQIADAAAPRRDRPADGPEVGAIGVLLIEPLNDVRSHANEGAKCGRGLDAVLASVPGGAKDDGDLLEVVDEEFSRLFVHV